MISSLRFLLVFVNKKSYFVLGYIALVLESATPVVAILLQRDLIDNVFIMRRYEEFPKLITLYAIFFFGPKLWFTVRRVAFYHIDYNLQMSLTHSFLKKIYDMPTSIFNKEHVGKLLNHIRNDIAEASDIAVNQLLSDSAKIILSLLFLSFSVGRISLRILMVVLLLAVTYYVLLRKYGEKTKLFSKAVKEEKSNMSVAVEESISAVREIIAYNRQRWQLDRYEQKFSDYFKAIIRQGLFKNKILLISEPFLFGTKIVVIIFGGMSVISNKISLGEFVVSFSLVDQLVSELGQLFNLALTGKRLVASVECIQSVMSTESVEFGTLDFESDVESIRFEEVTFSYMSESDKVLDNLTIDFPVGKKIALVGESGSGKSTIAQLLLRSYSPSKGEVFINEYPINHYGEGYTDKVSIVFQQPHFIPLSLKENLVFDMDYDQCEIEEVCKKMLCHDFIMEFSNRYETQVGERGVSLSGGQRQRLALSRAIIKNADVLVLDEATSALDVETEYHVQKNIDEIRKGKTTIIIAHRMSTIQNADVIYVLDKGRLVANGTHGELMKGSQVYRRLYETQEVS